MKTLSIHCIVILYLAASAIASNEPVLSIPERIPGVFGIPVAVPILFTGNGAAVSATIFSVDFDQTCLDFNPQDIDPVDGIPDDVLFMLPAQFTGSISHDPEDADGELDFVIADFGPPLASLPDGPIVYVILTPSCQPEETGILARVGFSQEPPASFGDTGGLNVPGTSIDGSIYIDAPLFADGFESGDTSAWAITVTGD